MPTSPSNNRKASHLAEYGHQMGQWRFGVCLDFGAKSSPSSCSKHCAAYCRSNCSVPRREGILCDQYIDDLIAVGAHIQWRKPKRAKVWGFDTDSQNGGCARVPTDKVQSYRKAIGACPDCFLRSIDPRKVAPPVTPAATGGVLWRKVATQAYGEQIMATNGRRGEQTIAAFSTRCSPGAIR